MGFNFNFRQIDSTQDIRKLIDFMAIRPLSYLEYDAWIQRSEPELYMEYKRAILAFSDLVLVGDVVYQKHKQLPNSLEIKNLRVNEKIRRRDFAHFMLKQVEAEAVKAGYGLILCDTRANQSDVLSLLQFSGFKEIVRAPLYDSNEEDVIFAKPLKQSKKEGLIRLASWFS